MIVSTFPPVVGGVQLATLALAKTLRSRGLRVVILTRRFPGTYGYEILSGVPVYRLGHSAAGKVGALLFAIHAFGLLATRLRDYRIVHVQNIDTPLLIGLAAKLLLRRRLIATVHGEAKIAFKEEHALGRIRLRLMRSIVDAYGALTDSMKQKLESLGISPASIYVIPNGVDTAHFRPPEPAERRSIREDLQLRHDDVVAVFVGRLVPLKNLHLVLEAWSKIDRGNYRLLIVGDGPDSSRLQRAASRLVPSTVRFVGQATDVRQFLWAADVFVLVSQREGLSLALLEAMATGLPSVISALPGHRALVSDGHDGCLVEPTTVEVLLGRLLPLMQCPSTRQRIGENARQRIVSGYSLDAVAEAHRRLYLEVSLQ